MKYSRSFYIIIILLWTYLIWLIWVRIIVKMHWYRLSRLSPKRAPWLYLIVSYQLEKKRNRNWDRLSQSTFFRRSRRLWRHFPLRKRCQSHLYTGIEKILLISRSSSFLPSLLVLILSISARFQTRSFDLKTYWIFVCKRGEKGPVKKSEALLKIGLFKIASPYILLF